MIPHKSADPLALSLFCGLPGLALPYSCPLPTTLLPKSDQLSFSTCLQSGPSLSLLAFHICKINCGLQPTFHPCLEQCLDSKYLINIKWIHERLLWPGFHTYPVNVKRDSETRRWEIYMSHTSLRQVSHSLMSSKEGTWPENGRLNPERKLFLHGIHHLSHEERNVGVFILDDD